MNKESDRSYENGNLFQCRNIASHEEFLKGKLQRIILDGPKHPQFKYFYSELDENKEKILKIHEYSYYKRLIYLFSGFGVFYGIKYLCLWKIGKFSNFFHYTKFTPPILFAMAIYFNHKNYYAKLANDGLLRYIEKRDSYYNTLNEIQHESLKRAAIEKTYKANPIQ
jgi:hypothetical protein